MRSAVAAARRSCLSGASTSSWRAPPASASTLMPPGDVNVGRGSALRGIPTLTSPTHVNVGPRARSAPRSDGLTPAPSTRAPPAAVSPPPPERREPQRATPTSQRLCTNPAPTPRASGRPAAIRPYGRSRARHLAPDRPHRRGGRSPSCRGPGAARGSLHPPWPRDGCGRFQARWRAPSTTRARRRSRAAPTAAPTSRPRPARRSRAACGGHRRPRGRGRRAAERRQRPLRRPPRHYLPLAPPRRPRRRRVRAGAPHRHRRGRPRRPAPRRPRDADPFAYEDPLALLPPARGPIPSAPPPTRRLAAPTPRTHPVDAAVERPGAAPQRPATPLAPPLTGRPRRAARAAGTELRPRRAAPGAAGKSRSAQASPRRRRARR